MLFGAGLPTRFWQHALRYANWCTNRLPTSALKGGIPFTKLYGREPSLSMAKVFGCVAHVWVPPDQRKKFGKRAEWGIFLGLPIESKGWEFYNPTSGVIGYLSRNAFFHEDRFLVDLKAKVPVDLVEEEKGCDPFPPRVFELFDPPTQPSPNGALGEGEHRGDVITHETTPSLDGDGVEGGLEPLVESLSPLGVPQTDLVEGEELMKHGSHASSTSSESCEE